MSAAAQLPLTARTRDHAHVPQLVCVECSKRAAGEASGWRAYVDDEGNAATFCFECAEREFPSMRSGRRSIGDEGAQWAEDSADGPWPDGV